MATIHAPQVDPREAVEVADAIRSLLEHPGWGHYQAAVAHHIERLTQSLLSKAGKVDAAEYEAVAGEIRALKNALPALIQGLLDRAER